jgi:anti-sigma factor (TIGR02949 family)
MDCKFVRARLDAYVDAELEPTPVIEFERHLDACRDCRNELSLARLVQRSVRELPMPVAPEALKARVLRALDDVSAQQQGAPLHTRGPWSFALAAAGGVLLVFGAVMQSDSSRGSAVRTAGASEMAPVRLLGDVVARHMDQLPAEIAADQPEQVTSWFRGKVAFRVRSVEFTEPKVRFMGARVSHIGAASLQQVLHDDQLVARWGARRARFGSRVLTYQNVDGYTVPILEHDGIVYAFTGDLDQRKLLQLVASAKLP